MRTDKQLGCQNTLFFIENEEWFRDLSITTDDCREVGTKILLLDFRVIHVIVSYCKFVTIFIYIQIHRLYVIKIVHNCRLDGTN
jgi:hypothetical protein